MTKVEALGYICGMRKRAYGVSDEYSIHDRFDPLYWSGDFKHGDPAAMSAAVKAFIDVAKKRKLKATLNAEEYGDAPVDPAKLLKHLSKLEADKAEFDYDDPMFPNYFYAETPTPLFAFSKRRRLRGNPMSAVIKALHKSSGK